MDLSGRKEYLCKFISVTVVVNQKANVLGPLVLFSHWKPAKLKKQEAQGPLRSAWSLSS